MVRQLTASSDDSAAANRESFLDCCQALMDYVMVLCHGFNTSISAAGFRQLSITADHDYPAVWRLLLQQLGNSQLAEYTGFCDKFVHKALDILRAAWQDGMLVWFSEETYQQWLQDANRFSHTGSGIRPSRKKHRLQVAGKVDTGPLAAAQQQQGMNQLLSLAPPSGRTAAVAPAEVGTAAVADNTGSRSRRMPGFWQADSESEVDDPAGYVGTAVPQLGRSVLGQQHPLQGLLAGWPVADDDEALIASVCDDLAGEDTGWQGGIPGSDTATEQTTAAAAAALAAAELPLQQLLPGEDAGWQQDTSATLPGSGANGGNRHAAGSGAAAGGTDVLIDDSAAAEAAAFFVAYAAGAGTSAGQAPAVAASSQMTAGTHPCGHVGSGAAGDADADAGAAEEAAACDFSRSPGVVDRMISAGRAYDPATAADAAGRSAAAAAAQQYTAGRVPRSVGDEHPPVIPGLLQLMQMAADKHVLVHGPPGTGKTMLLRLMKNMEMAAGVPNSVFAAAVRSLVALAVDLQGQDHTMTFTRLCDFAADWVGRERAVTADAAARMSGMQKLYGDEIQEVTCRFMQVGISFSTACCAVRAQRMELCVYLVLCQHQVQQ